MNAQHIAAVASAAALLLQVLPDGPARDDMIDARHGTAAWLADMADSAAWLMEQAGDAAADIGAPEAAQAAWDAADLLAR